ncbi:hypothetical protein [Streptomyces sp. NPDC004788]
MEAELVALATTGATALVQHMVSDGWERARTRIAAYFAARSGADEEAVGAELEAARDELIRAERSGDEETATEARTEAHVEWRARMRRSLLADPESARELQEILDELAGAEGPAERPTMVVNNSISGGVNHGLFIQTGTVGPVTAHRAGGTGVGGGQDGSRP